MSGTWARTRARERIEAIAAEPLDATHLRRRVLAVLREVIDYDAYVWLLTDPVTMVGAAPLAAVPCLPELPALIKAKYATRVNRWTVLQGQDSAAARLHEAKQLLIRRAELLDQGQHADVLHESGEERLVARHVPQSLGQLAGGDGLD